MTTGRINQVAIHNVPLGPKAHEVHPGPETEKNSQSLSPFVIAKATIATERADALQ